MASFGMVITTLALRNPPAGGIELLRGAVKALLQPVAGGGHRLQAGLEVAHRHAQLQQLLRKFAAGWK